MGLSITAEQVDLAESVGKFADRHAAVDVTRRAFDAIAAGELPGWWPDFVTHGFHAVHLPESLGGQGGSVADMACVVDAAAAALLPGPLLSTAMAGAVGLLAGDSAHTLVSELAAGATAAVVLPEDSEVRAIADADGWLLDGSSSPVLGICAAQRILLYAHTDDGHGRWLVLDAEQATVVAGRGTDLCTDVGELRLTDLRVDAPAELSGIDTERARCLVASLTACAAAATARQCVSAAIEYIRVREQFGRPVGSFQALAHKAAGLYVNTELATAAAWDAVRAVDEPLAQHRLAAGSAVLVAVATAADLVLDALVMFGAIGYTWEHDAHLYWRRATSLAASLGPMTRWARDVGTLARDHVRSNSVDVGDAEPEFRAWVAETLDKASALVNAHPSDVRRNPGLATGEQRDLLAASGLAAPTLPAPWGVGASPVQQVIVAQEFARRPEITRPSLGIAEWILPTILTAGTDWQRERFAEPILRGVQSWCQLFSEPEAGSDLASLRTRAVKVDGGWLVNGHKIWTSMAQRADYGAMLARTDPDARKHRGIGYFLVDMTSPGVEVVPIKQASGRSEFNEVFLTDVFVPDEMLVGGATDGWNQAVSTMAVERTAIGNYVAIDRTGALRRLAKSDGPDLDAVLGALGDVEAHTNAIKALVLRETLRQVDGQGPGPTSSIAKYAMVLLLRRAWTATLALTGRDAMVEDSDSELVAPYFDMPAELIGGGTAEVQLSIIASVLLGLPRG